MTNRAVPINLGPITGHTVRHGSASRDRVPEGKGLYLLNPTTRQVLRVSESEAAQAQAAAAVMTRRGRAVQTRRGR